jgi:ATPase subunit of ABC transporter with duplicated ATPase domains
VLDEPTNHLDMESIQALAQALAVFDGTVIFVSHDRWFVAELATRVIEVTRQGVRDFPGTYAESLSRAGDDHLDADTVTLKAKKEKQEASSQATADNALSWEEQKRRKNRSKDLLTRREKVTAILEDKEKTRARILEKTCKDGFYQSTPVDEQKRLLDDDAALAKEIDALMAEWESIEAELESLPG